MRKSGTLLLSATMWRVLAGVFHVLKKHRTHEEITALFRQLDPSWTHRTVWRKAGHVPNSSRSTHPADDGRAAPRSSR